MRMKRRCDIAAEFSISTRTVDRKIDGIRGEIGRRYNPTDLIEDGGLVLINEVVFLDWLTFGGLLADKRLRGNVPPFDRRATGVSLDERG